MQMRWSYPIDQVFDLRERSPGEVLQQLYMTLERLQHDGDFLAGEIQRRLRIIVRSFAP